MEPQDFNHLVRTLHSYLVDADYLDTERFMSPESFSLRGEGPTMAQLAERLRRHMDSLTASARPSPVNTFRASILDACRKAASMPQGFYSLTVPTGGGKTLASVSWVLAHAVAHGLRRVIIAIPYTSITAQTAKIFRDIFGDENVLEHHRATAADDDGREQVDDVNGLLTENVELEELMMV
ncbi:MAG: hypothetical protein II375_00810 [Bacteroidales bacterium]|nr:hypothetical protein [Bacteroidales bacterium]